MNRIALLFAMAVLAASGYAAPDLSADEAEDVIRASRTRVSFVSKSTRSRMVIVDRGGNVAERVVDQYTLEGNGKAGLRKMFVFQKPASVANTRFLTVSNPRGSEDRWIFLPALRKVRRISAGEGSGSFLGTDLSYDDLSSSDRDPGLDTHEMTGEEKVGDRSCVVVRSVPRDSGYQYSKMVSWIEKGTYLLARSEYYDRKGELTKVMELLSAEVRQDRLIPIVIKMSTVAAGTSTTIHTDIVKYDEAIPESIFTAKFLETGRP